MQYRLTSEGEELTMTAKNPLTSVEQLTAATTSYRTLLTKAIRTASTDAETLKKLGEGLAALTKATTAIEKLRQDTVEENDDDINSIEFDNMGNVIRRKKVRA